MQTRQPAVRTESMRREEQAGVWQYSYSSQPSTRTESRIAWVSAIAYVAPTPHLTVSVPVDDDAWSDETLPTADFIARIKALLAEAVAGAL